MPLDDKIAASVAFLTPVIVIYATTWIIPPILVWALFVQTKWTEGLRLHIRSGGDGGRGIRFEPAPAISR